MKPLPRIVLEDARHAQFWLNLNLVSLLIAAEDVTRVVISRHSTNFLLYNVLSFLGLCIVAFPPYRRFVGLFMMVQA
jgi:hypothetical protein